ncbi:MAG TPA: transglutaminase-like domain-containing protein [Sandaracinaceae bacterium LLY-WYZ-13_1]|nr:transglutaminase-like domain-containing protein [Sandaracinaceae bacterium LLY-WYZ-13_1]
MSAPPRELDLVAAVRRETVSPEVAALLIARDAKPDLDVDAQLARLDDLAGSLGEVRPGASPREQAQQLAGHLFERWGFRGNEAEYFDPRNSYLDEVLRRRTGIPITLCLVLAAVGRRVGVQVEGIGFPGHFLARVGGLEGVLVDPFFGGRLLDATALERLAARMLGRADRLDPARHLAPVGLRPLVVRMLLNLKHAHERRGEHARALVVCDRLVDLTAAPAFRRDRGLHALALGAREQAVDDLSAYLEAEGDRAKDAARVRQALSRARADEGPMPS